MPLEVLRSSSIHHTLDLARVLVERNLAELLPSSLGIALGIDALDSLLLSHRVPLEIVSSSSASLSEGLVPLKSESITRLGCTLIEDERARIEALLHAGPLVK